MWNSTIRDCDRNGKQARKIKTLCLTKLLLSRYHLLILMPISLFIPLSYMRIQQAASSEEGEGKILIKYNGN